MDAVSGVASVTQLIAYSHVVAQRLVQLYKAAQEGPSCCQTQRVNIRFLLELIQRICADEAPNTEVILPLLIATVNLANSLLKLLQPKGTLYNHWLWVSKGQEIESTFSALNDKTRLLQLHITERTYSIMTHVQKDIKHMNQSLKRHSSHVNESPSSSSLSTMFKSSQDTEAAQVATKSSSTMSKSPQDSEVAQLAMKSNSTADCGQNIKGQEHRLKVTSNGNQLKDDAQQLVGNGWGPMLANRAPPEVTSNGNKIEKSLQAVGNADSTPAWSRRR